MHPRSIALALVAGVVHVAGAQSNNLPPIRKLGPVVATSPKSFRGISIVRVLPDGKLLINDVTSRRLVLTDTTLAAAVAVLDSGASSRYEYGARPGGLIAYRGDSTLFVDVAAPSIYLIDPNAKVVRTLSVPAPRDAGWMIQSGVSGSWPGSDALGRLIYRGQAPRNPEPPAKAGEWLPFAFPDSAPIQRVDFTTRKSETLSWFKLSKLSGVMTLGPNGRSYSFITNRPLPVMDDFAVLSDGTIAVLRGDYHVDFIDGDGKITASPKIPYPWERLSDDAKVALVDSVKQAFAARSNRPATTMSGGTSGSGGGGGGLTAPTGDRPEPPDEMRWSKPSDLPDYRPAFQQGALRAGADASLWIRTLQPTRAANIAIYDVVNRSGTLIDRVELPADRSIVGFDATSVYLTWRDASGAWLERVKIK
jgi:hypothetical protein